VSSAQTIRELAKLCPERLELAKQLRACRAKLRDAPSTEERVLRPSDVPATLLNVALSNLSAGEEAPRAGAYNLIVELATFFKYNIPPKMMKTPG
jgi:neurofibromin 1